MLDDRSKTYTNVLPVAWTPKRVVCPCPPPTRGRRITVSNPSAAATLTWPLPVADAIPGRAGRLLAAMASDIAGRAAIKSDPGSDGDSSALASARCCWLIDSDAARGTRAIPARRSSSTRIPTDFLGVTKPSKTSRVACSTVDRSHDGRVLLPDPALRCSNE